MDIRIFIRCDILTGKIDSYLYKYCRDHVVFYQAKAFIRHNH